MKLAKQSLLCLLCFWKDLEIKFLLSVGSLVNRQFFQVHVNINSTPFDSVLAL